MVHAVRDHSFLPEPAGIWVGEWLTFGSSPVTADAVEVWPYSVGLLVKLVTLLGRCTRPRLERTLGKVVYLLWRFSFYMSFGLVKGLSWKSPFPGNGGLDAQFQCQLFGVR